MKTTGKNRVKRTLTAVLLMFVLSLGAVFAGTDPMPGAVSPASDDIRLAAVDTASADTAAEKSHIIKKGRYYYYQYDSGKIRTKKGFVTDCGKIYYVRKGGKIRTNKSFKVKKKYYRANKKGVILTGVYTWNGKLNYSSSKGKWKKKAGFVKWKGNRYYVQKGGTIITDDAFVVDNLPYSADAFGRVTDIPLPSGKINPVLAVAQKQVGVMTGKTYWKWYFHTKFVDTDRTPWCGTFVAWCFNKAGKYDKVTKIKNLGYVPNYTKYANKYGKWIKPATAKGGDIIIFGRNNAHVGLVEAVYKDYIITIEGNAGPTAAFGCGKAGACVRKIYRLNNDWIKGVIRVM